MKHEGRMLLVHDGLATVAEAQEFTSLSRSKLYSMTGTGQVALVKLGRARRIPWRALIELTAANVRGGWIIPRADDRP
jgi:hypothetical protein